MTLNARVISHHIFNIFKPHRNSSSLSRLHTKITIALNPIPENTYERSNRFTMQRLKILTAGHYSILETSLCSKTAQSKFRIVNADRGKARSWAEHCHKRHGRTVATLDNTMYESKQIHLLWIQPLAYYVRLLNLNSKD